MTRRRVVIEPGTQSYVKEIRKLWETNRALEAKIKKLEAERPKGHWIMKWHGNGWNEAWDYTCSACGKEFRDADSVLYNSSYCPNCGAEIMVGGDEWRLDDD